MAQKIKILIIGNGFGGVYALKNLHKIFHNGSEASHIELSLVGEKNYFLFTPLLHEVATGGINPQNIIEPIRKVLGCCLHNFYLGRAEFINTRDHTVKVGNTLLSYDYLILAPGAQTNFYGIAQAEKYSFPLKSIEDAIKIKNHCIILMERASHVADSKERKKMLKFVVVGGGATGVELAAELQELIKENFSRYYLSEIIKDASVILIEKGSELMSQFGIKIRKKSLDVLRKKGIEVKFNTTVKEVDPSSLIFTDGTSISTETIIWVAGIKPAGLEFSEAVSKSPTGRLIVNEYLQLENHKEIFAIGDVSAFKHKNIFLPLLAQVAQKEAGHVAKNIQLLIKGSAAKPFSYCHSGNLVSLGRWMAVGEIFNFTFSGHFTWWLWRTVYLFKLISFRKKFEVAIDWTINIFSARDISQF